MSFVPSSSHTPGRLNFFHFKNFSFLADFAHNPHGLQLLCDFVSKLDYPKKIGLISGTGDRRDEDIKGIGTIAAKYFDEIIIRTDKDLRGRSADEIINLLRDAVTAENPAIPVMIMANEEEALEYIYAHPQEGALYTIMCDEVSHALEKIKELRDREFKS
jgi:cyanophycin synthetase